MSDPIFQNGLQDLVRGIRSNKRDPKTFISQQIVEIKNELKSTDTYIKAEAVRKLTYLQMIGYDVSWASFAIVEVMSQSKFAHKRIGYLAANQSFTDTTDVILLTTNLFKKEFNSTYNQYEIGVAINCLANIATHDLARDCIADLVTLMGHQKPYIRKKTVLAMFKLYVKYPQGLRLSFDSLKERLEDTESSVVSTAVNVICELAYKNPRNYLSMAPQFFRLLTTSSNNWMLIKVVKLLGALVSEEPRLARKLLDPLATIIKSTGAKSLQYECIHTITQALIFTKKEDGSDAKNASEVVQLCSDHLKGFVEDMDQNLKYLGLVGLADLMKSHPRVVIDHRDLILGCLGDEDVTIRTRALELLSGIVSKKSLIDLVNHLLEHLQRAEESYQNEIIAAVLSMCKRDKFAMITDFAWYAGILADLAVVLGSQHGGEVAAQLMEVALRVEEVRPFIVETVLSLLFDERLVLSQARHSVAEALRASAWVIGEYATVLMHIAQDYHSDDDEERGYWILGPQEEEIRSTWRGKPLHSLVLAALLHPRATKLPAHVQVVYINSAMKVFAAACADWDETQLTKSISILRQKLPAFTQSEHLEVQERACLLRQLLAELGVLSLTWKSALDAQHQRSGVSSNALKVDTGKKNGKGSGSDAISSILDVMAAVDKESATTDEVDSQGARVAKQKFRILKAMLNEPFHPVHPKAQRKVPPPVELDLDEPFLKTSLDQLLAVSVPDKGNLSDLAFTSPYVSSSFAPSSALAGIGGGYTHYADDESDPGRNTWTDISPTTKSNTSAASTSASRLVSNTAMSANSMYYLQSNSSGMHEAQPVNPLSKLLAETFEDKKTKKGRVKRVKQRINSTEQLPAGAIDNDSDEDIPSSQHVHHKARPRRSDNGDGLDAVDLSTPLRDDETYVVMKHREVPEEVSPRNSGIDHTSKEASNDKKKKKKKSTYSLTGNLLDGIDEVPDQVRSNGRKSKTHKTDDLLGLSASSQPSIPSTATITVSNSAIVVAPPTTSVMTGGAVHLSTRNKITDSFRDLGLDDTDDSPSLLQPTLQPPQSVGFTLTSLQPYELSQDQFVDLLGKASHHWSSASIRVPYHSKTRNATKALATLLKAYTIDSESSRVSSLCARSTAGDYVCCLLKYKKDAGEVAIDIKCKSEGIDKNYSERILKIVVEAITAVTL